MASNSTINVKVPTKALIKSLKERLAQIKKDKAGEEKARSDYDKAIKAWEEGFTNLVPKAQKPSNVELIRHPYGIPDDKVKIEVTYLIPKNKVADKPKTPDFMSAYEYEEATQSIASAIRLLEMTEEDFVSTSSYKSISKYL